MQKENKQFEEQKLLIAKVNDKLYYTLRKNKISYTDFLDMYQQSVLKKEIGKNAFFYGGYDGSERNLVVFYPDKIDLKIARKYVNGILKVIRITLPNDLIGKYEHRVFLSGIMKIGLEREKFGDIVVSESGADIVVFEENSQYIKDSLINLKRFSKSKVEILDIDEISSRNDSYEEFTIVVSSMRLDCIVSEIGRFSRSMANDIIESERVFINSELICRNSKLVNLKDILTIRGKGKFIIDECIRKTDKRKVGIKNKEKNLVFFKKMLTSLIKSSILCLVSAIH